MSEPSDTGGTTTAATGGAGRPRIVATSFWLWVAAIAVFLVGSIAPDPVDNAVSGVLVAVIVGAAAVWLLLAVKMRQGRDWARLLVAWLSAGYVVGSVLVRPIEFFGGSGSVLAAVCNRLELVLVVAAVVLMFLPGAKAYFRQSRS